MENIPQHIAAGRKGEEFAEKLLLSKRYRIEERNWRLGHLEIDLIASNKKDIVFVEVKTRSSHFANKNPEEYVDYRKQSHLITAANAYTKYHKTDKRIRFDVIGVMIDKDTLEIIDYHHLEDVFYPKVRTISMNRSSANWTGNRYTYTRKW